MITVILRVKILYSNFGFRLYPEIVTMSTETLIFYLSFQRVGSVTTFI